MATSGQDGNGRHGTWAARRDEYRTSRTFALAPWTRTFRDNIGEKTMQRSIVATALITAVVFGVGGWLLASKTEKVKPPRPTPIHGKCSSGDCNVKVKFACTTPTNPTNETCIIFTDPDVILIKAGDRIKFTIDNPTGFTFKFDATDGIKFTSSKFTCATNGSGQKYKCDNTLSSADPVDAFYYSVHVTGFDVVDPWAVNY